jgi:hypothetical protein
VHRKRMQRKLKLKRKRRLRKRKRRRQTILDFVKHRYQTLWKRRG